MKKIIATLALAGALCIGAVAPAQAATPAPSIGHSIVAPSWYSIKGSTCTSTVYYREVIQRDLFLPWITRTVCAKKGEVVQGWFIF